MGYPSALTVGFAICNWTALALILQSRSNSTTPCRSNLRRCQFRAPGSAFPYPSPTTGSPAWLGRSQSWHRMPNASEGLALAGRRCRTCSRMIEQDDTVGITAISEIYPVVASDAWTGLAKDDCPSPRTQSAVSFFIYCLEVLSLAPSRQSPGRRYRSHRRPPIV